MKVERPVQSVNLEKEVDNAVKGTDQKPMRVTENLFQEKPRGLKRLFMKKEDKDVPIVPEPETIEPILMLMKENGYTDTVHNVKAGEFIISTPKGEKSIWLMPDKMQAIRMGDKYYRGWIAYENCMTPYPEDPIYSSELQRRIVQKIAINYRDINEAAIMTARTKMWLWIIGGVVIAAILIFSTPFGKDLIANLGKPAAEAAAQAAPAAAAGTLG